jgi:hypothetical protein
MLGPEAPAVPPQPSFAMTLLASAAPERHATWTWWALGRDWVQAGEVAPSRMTATVRRIGIDAPEWRTPWVYAGLMLQTQGDGPAAEPLLVEGAARWPTDPWFPAALGVTLQDQGRVDEARQWLDKARSLP